MTHVKKPPRALMWCTLFVMAAIVIATGITNRSAVPKGIKIETQDQPTLGYTQAKVHIVVFEEPKCFNCKNFSIEIFPLLKKEFIDTKKVLYTMIPVSFLPDSMPAAVALLSVYNANPKFPNSDLFFKYAEAMYRNQPDENSNWATPTLLIDFAKKASPAIDLTQLQQDIALEKHRNQIEKNTLYGKEIMGGMISTPTVYINGVEVKDLSYENLWSLIRTFLNHAGVY